MERNTNHITMEGLEICQNVSCNSRESGHDVFQLPSQANVLDPVSSENPNIGLPNLNVFKTKPVLNFSIQTGEEFALEFMRDRAKPKKPFISNVGVDSSFATGYTELKGILGINHIGSESGSDISMLTIAEKVPREVERRNSSLYDEKSNYGSIQSVPLTSSGYESRGLINGNASCGASDHYSNRMKVLCSFGGKILPRPSDRKPRYVGGETRIMCITRNISFQQLKQKILAIYSETHAIKYQLPGEDLDALVSVSCDEDLLNMMEEWHDGDDSQKHRMFLFSIRDLDDAQFGLANIERDSEIQYLVAVNGLDMGSGRSLTTHDLTNSLGNNSAEINRSSIDREMSQVENYTVGISTSHLIGTFHSSRPIVQSSPSSCETYPQFYQGQLMDHTETKQLPLHYHYSTSDSYPLGECPHSTPIYRFMNQEGWTNEGQHQYNFQVQNSHLFEKEVKPTSDPSVQQAVDAEKTCPPGKVYPVPVDEVPGAASLPGSGLQVQNSHTLIKEVKAESDPSIQQVIDAEKAYPLENVYFDPEEISDAVSMPGGGAHSLPPKTDGKCQQLVNVSSSDATNMVHVPKSCEDDQCSSSSSRFGPRHADPIPNPIDLSYLEPSLPSQRGYYSERITRGQTELLKKFSKSDDTLGSQFLISHSNIAEQNGVTESVENLPAGNLVAHTEPSTSAGITFYAGTQTIDDGFAQHQGNKKFTDLASHMNMKLSDSEAVLECGSKPAVPSDVDIGDCEKRGRILNTDCEIDNSIGNLEKVSADGTGEAETRCCATAQETSVVHHRDPASDDPQCADIAGNDISGANNLGQLEPPKKNGDIQIDIYDRFPRDLLSEIFSKGIFTEDCSGISLAHREGAVGSVNMENREHKHWSYFQKLAQEEFVQKDVSLIDQDDLGTPALIKVEDGDPEPYLHKPLTADGFSMVHEYSKFRFGENNQNNLPGISEVESTMLPDFDHSEVKESESMQFDAMIENLKSPESEYEDGNLENRNVDLPPFDPSLGGFDVNTLQIIEDEDLEELRELGSGTFGTVYHGKWRGTDVAIKRLKKICFAGRSSEQERLTLDFWHEAEILSRVQHPNVVAFYGVAQDGPGGALATVTEYMVDGSLRHVLLQKDRYLDSRKKLLIAMDAAFGMEYLHSKNVVHFDLKCDNLLVNLKDPQRPICKVGDFGLSKIKCNTLVSGGVRGTLPWMAPELLGDSSNKVSEKVDVFSFGIVLWEILTGEEPYANMHYGAIIGGIVNNTLRPIIPSFCDPEWKRLMEQCWAPNPSFRPSFTEIASRLCIMSTAASQSKGHHSNRASK